MSRKKSKLLIVDDAPSNHRVYHRILEPLGLDIISANSGQEALEAAYRHDFFLILMDVQMPGMDGFETAALILDHPETSHIPIIFITAIARDEAFEFRGYKQGAVDYLVKPVNDDILACKIKVFLELHQQKKQLQETFDTMSDLNEQLKGEIAERRRTETALVESEEKYRTMMESMRDAAYICSPDRRIAYMNPRMIQLAGRDALGEPCHKAVFNNDRPCSFCAHETVQKGRHAEFECTHPESGRIYNVTVSPIFHAGGAVSALAVFHDMTEKKAMEDQLNQAQKMESVGRLAGGVAHDYNNMLTIITGFTELAMAGVDPEGPLHEDLSQILSAAQRGTEITRQLLAFARKQVISPRVLELNDSMEDMLKMLRRLIGEDIDLVWLPKAGLWPVKMDTAQIDQIIVNLCINARDAIEGVGKITIETQNLSLDKDVCKVWNNCVPGDYVMLAVNDNGCGIGKDALDQIFEPFFTTKDVDKGTGLGLSTIYGIVEQNNGFIKVYSEPGVGTTFKVYFPRHQAKAEKSPALVTEIITGNEEVIFLVEDDPAILRLTSRMLSDLGYTVVSAGEPNEAINRIREHTGKLHLLITDVIMPDMNGRELSDRATQLHPGIKTLFISGYSADILDPKGIQAHEVHFLQKPFSMGDLARKIQNIL